MRTPEEEMFVRLPVTRIEMWKVGDEPEYRPRAGFDASNKFDLNAILREEALRDDHDDDDFMTK